MLSGCLRTLLSMTVPNAFLLKSGDAVPCVPPLHPWLRTLVNFKLAMSGVWEPVLSYQILLFLLMLSLWSPVSGGCVSVQCLYCISGQIN